MRRQEQEQEQEAGHHHLEKRGKENKSTTRQEMDCFSFLFSTFNVCLRLALSYNFCLFVQGGGRGLTIIDKGGGLSSSLHFSLSLLLFIAVLAAAVGKNSECEPRH